VPPDTGICHQVNLEYLGQVVFRAKENGATVAYPDTLVGMDSHTPMINGLGVVGWGVGGIEAEAALLGQPIVMLIPDVVGFKLHGKLREGATSTDLVLTVTQNAAQKKAWWKNSLNLRLGTLKPEHRGSSNDRQYGAGVWRHDRFFPRR